MPRDDRAADPKAPPLPPALHPRGPSAARRDTRAGLGRSAPASGRPGRRTARTAAWVFGVRLVAAALSVSVLAGTGYAWASYQHFTSGLTQVDAIPGAPGGKDLDGSAQNILLVGDDHRPANASPAELALLSTGQDGGSTNTDTMMVLHLPAGGGAPTVISFPRDSWVDIPGFGKGKLNSAFADGSAHGGGDAAGMRLLIQTIQQLTGLSIDHFVRVSLLGFYDIADVLGPIQVCLAHPARDSYSGIDLPAGVSTLNAKQALSFVRQRHGLLRGDLDREVRQQYFLATELHKILSAGTLLDPGKTQALLSAVSSSVETDTGLDVLGLAGRFATLSADKVTFTTIPVSGTPTITDAAGNPLSIVRVDTAALPAFIDHVLAGTGSPGSSGTTTGGGTPATPPSPLVDPAGITVQVVNATGRTGLAATTSATLAHLGFRTAAPANAPTRTTTVLTYPPAMQAQAQVLASHISGAALQPSPSTDRLVLLLGTDGARVTTGAAVPDPSPPPTATPPSSGQAFTPGTCIN